MEKRSMSSVPKDGFQPGECVATVERLDARVNELQKAVKDMSDYVTLSMPKELLAVIASCYEVKP
jgi:hypothetical protein